MIVPLISKKKCGTLIEGAKYMKQVSMREFKDFERRSVSKSMD